MNRIIILLILNIFTLTSINAQNCKNIPTHFNSYAQAISRVKDASFKIKEEVNTSKSSWIRSASYYSCDGNTGYFIYSTDKQEYIHEGVPIKIWRDFKNADSFGSFYDRNIKHRYLFYLN
jgi:hypothetical protein